MTKTQMVDAYKRMSNEEPAGFDRWLKANAVIGTVFAAAFLAMAVAGSGGPGPREAMAESAAGTTATTAGAILSPLELMSRLDPAQLPVQQTDAPI